MTETNAQNEEWEQVLRNVEHAQYQVTVAEIRYGLSSAQWRLAQGKLSRAMLTDHTVGKFTPEAEAKLDQIQEMRDAGFQRAIDNPAFKNESGRQRVIDRVNENLRPEAQIAR